MKLRRPARIRRSDFENIDASGLLRVHDLRIDVEPDERRGYVWSVTVLYVYQSTGVLGRMGPHESMMSYEGGGSFRHPHPGTARGRAKNAMDADIAARACADDARARLAAHRTRGSQRRTSRVPL